MFTFFCLQVQTLCQDWFPIDYPLSWYIDITSSDRFFALAAVYNCTIIGLIVAEIKPYMRLSIEARMITVKMQFLIFLFVYRKQDRDILPESTGCDVYVGYILSLGVHKKHRRNGIGSLLLDALFSHLTSADQHKVKAIFLHVLTTNKPAILFYEKRRQVK